MGLEKRTVKIIGIVVVILLVIGCILGLVLGLLLTRRYVELEVWPRTEEYRWEEPLIEFRPSDPGSWHIWYSRINDFLRDYETATPDQPPRAPCSTHNRRDQQLRSDSCESAMRFWSPCTADDFYGYHVGKPCVFLRLTHTHYWVPEPYNISTVVPMVLPPDMPEHLRRAMMQYPVHQFGDHAWLTCDGERSSDKENVGPIQYIPAELPPGFRLDRLATADRLSYYMRNQPDRVPPPLIAVFFENPRRGVLISVECRIWTRDIYYDRYSRIGRARFELYVN
ncbi:sodium/potassium-transporting ATPase subunit beta-2-like [Amyelois transitella]|uniref:sodium/potassium-transporting ATPase subunit beta-2-like n=1 Tax=Amyelois transitella TaxID=680683 RepID=UPI00067D4360|nr:sodium/potassium-transporting ATPase subunit beta-2-like [Amyelois transitella]